MGYSFILRTERANSEGQYPIALRVSKHGKRRRINIGVSAMKDYWDAEQERLVVKKGLKLKEEKELNEKRIKDNAYIEKLSHRAKSVIEKFDEEKVDWTVSQFVTAFAGKVNQGNFYEYLHNHIDVLQETGHTGNAKCYIQAELMLLKFDKRLKERLFSEVDIRYVNRFDSFLQKRGCSGNTRKYYHKSIRAVYNKAIKEKVAPETHYPYGKGGFEVAALEEETEKRYLTNEDLEKLKSTTVSSEAQEFARILFLFSYYCYGMAFVDMAHLKKKNVVKYDGGRYIVYKREKTKTKRKVKAIQVKITEEIDNIIEALCRYREPIGEYLLPVISIDHSGDKLYDHIRQRNKRFNINLKNLAEKLEIDFKLTSYVARHTMAMRLQGNSVSREVISQMLGHKDLSTTNTYLDSLDSSVIDAAADSL